MTLEKFFRRDQKKRAPGGPKGVDLPDLWSKCPQCGAQVYNKDLEANLHLCPECSFHHRMPVRPRVAMLSDPGTFEEWSGDVWPGDPLEFVDSEPYPARLERYQRESGRPDAILTGGCTVEGQRIALAVMDYHFSGGSMGSVVGEEIARATERAADEHRGLVIVCASGGARMQEGALSLMQMAKTTAALTRLGDARLPFLSILTDPTTGGVTASFATLGDVIFAEPGALIGFAGPRVIQQTIRQDLPKGFQRSEFLLEHGMVDRVVNRKEMKAEIALTLRHLMPEAEASA